MIGLTSVTFRNLDIHEIIDLAKKTGMDGIEWGGDIHVPAGNLEIAKIAAQKTIDAGLRVLSYGSYYYLCKNENVKESFLSVLESARALGAPNIRVWGGKISLKDVDEEFYKAAAKELQEICEMAQEYGITISLEYHRNSLTENAQSALKLLQMADCSNLRSYWQPKSDISHEQNCKEIELIHSYISNVHVFQWKGNNVRFKLEDGRNDWLNYINTIGADLNKSSYILEFVKDNNPEIFIEDANTLKDLLIEIKYISSNKSNTF